MMELLVITVGVQLARRGFNVALLSKPEEKLYQVAAEISETVGIRQKVYNVHLHAGERFGQKTLAIPVDFLDDFDLYTHLTEKLSGLDIGILSKKTFNT